MLQRVLNISVLTVSPLGSFSEPSEGGNVRGMELIVQISLAESRRGETGTVNTHILHTSTYTEYPVILLTERLITCCRRNGMLCLGRSLKLFSGW